MENDKLKKALERSATEEFDNIQRETIKWEPSAHFKNETEKLFDSKHKQNFISLKRVLLIAAVVFLISSLAVLSSAKVRTKVITFFTQNKGDHFDVEYGYDSPGDISSPADLSDSFELDLSEFGFVKKSENAFSDASDAVWENEDGETIIFGKGNGQTSRTVDSETLVKKTVVKNAAEITAYTQDGYTLLLWNTFGYTYSVDYFGGKTYNELIDFLARANLFTE